MDNASEPSAEERVRALEHQLAVERVLLWLIVAEADNALKDAGVPEPEAYRSARRAAYLVNPAPLVDPAPPDKKARPLRIIGGSWVG